MRWASCIVGSIAAFGLSWWALQGYVRLDEPVAVGVAVVPFTVALTVGGVWAVRKRKSEAANKRLSVKAIQVHDSDVSGTLAGASFGPNADFRHAQVLIGSQEKATSQPSRGEEPDKRAARLIFGEIAQRPPAFQERSEQHANLEKASFHRGAVLVVTGLRGVGKTQFAASIARRSISEGWRLVAWVNGADYNQLLVQLNQLAHELALVRNDEDLDPKSSGLRVRHWLESNGDRCLLVFDNVLDPDAIRPFLPIAGKALVLVTSYRRSLISVGDPLLVEVFTPAQAVTFLAERTGRIDDENARLVAADVGYLPLALAQAAAVIVGQNLSYDTYRERLLSTDAAKTLLNTEDDPYPLGAAESIMLSISAAESKGDACTCRRVMELVSLLDISGVPRELIYAVEEQACMGSAADIDSSLQNLAAYSLLNWSIDGSSVSLHRLIARVVRERAVDDGTLAAIASQGIDTLQLLTRKDKGKAKLLGVKKSDLVAQVFALSKHSENFSNDIDSEHRRTFSSLMFYGLGFIHGNRHATAIKLEEEGKFDDAIEILEQLLAEMEQFNVGAPDTRKSTQADLVRIRAKRDRSG